MLELLENPLPFQVHLTQNFKLASKLKASASNKMKGTEKLKILLGKVENIVGKGENASHEAFSFFPIMFSFVRLLS